MFDPMATAAVPVVSFLIKFLRVDWEKFFILLLRLDKLVNVQVVWKIIFNSL
jgi:hypothetical protein